MPPAPDLSDFEFFGETFHMRPSADYEWEMMEFAAAAKGGADSDLLSGAASVFEFLRAIVVEDEWDRFRATAKANRATVDDNLMPLVVMAFTQRTRRPTVRPSDSSDGPKSTKRKSGGGSSSRVVKRLEKKGRPDLALMVTMAEESSAA